ncbi:ATP-binding protein [Marinobacter sp. bablab_jr008]|uniref:ATP-binding protein n=1 Tax=Marinobacter sp. bablab_jr008 TaxID=2755064 RepID=UPI0018F1DB2E|nr:ATP-binding protein [Marinobacter sp. bablab_jr008]MEC9039926.1 ATP-binding protein [Pseudomonadota bacterium]MEC9385242.1 ATP-binding protein [Pseudomonadota bacterium]|tara:strand:+ start:737 stop:2680 length:1944 start_codon:yes stop_codon:yes gene_type:complete
MHEFTAEELLEQLQLLDECPRIEAKKGSDIGDSVMQTVCAYANEPGLGGGYLLLGVSEPDDEHRQFYVSGINNGDQILGQLQTNCREQFEQSIPVSAETVQLQGKTVILVFVPELEPVAKPCAFKGKFDKKNKRKTGVWRRGLNGDYECTQAELEPLLLAKSGLGFEQVVLPGAEWDDLDPDVIVLYRQLRARVRPHAEELQVSDQEMLRALNLAKKHNGEWLPNVAGLLLMGKPLALRRLLPSVRVDYVRISGTQWVEDPEQRFQTTLDLREPLLRLIPKLEATILDDLPKHFRLDEGSTQRSDQPLLPQKVVREAVVNALMHRDYQVQQPILVVRYSNRIDIRNAGYSLKPEAMLGEMGSKLRNPVLAAVLYDLNFAETKGSGIRTMRSLLQQVGLAAPVFSSHVIANEFQATYLLHQLLGEDQLAWLSQFKYLQLTNDEARALILAKETGAVDNAGLRAVTGLDTLSASQVLGRLHHQHGLLVKGGAGPATYYQLADRPLDSGELPLFGSQEAANTSDLGANTGDLGANEGDLGANEGDLPGALALRIKELTPKTRKDKLWPVILWLCALRPYKAEQLASLLGGRSVKSLKSTHLNVLREREKMLAYLFAEVVNHPDQAYQTTEKGIQWLREQGIDPNWENVNR